MVRTEVQLTEEQHRRLEQWAKERGMSLSQAIQQCVDEKLSTCPNQEDRTEQIRVAFSVLGKYSDPGGPPSVAEDRDEADEARRKMEELGITEEDVAEAIRAVRSGD